MSDLFSGPPLFGVFDAASESLVGVLLDLLFQAFQQVEGVGHAPREPAKHVVGQLPDFVRVRFYPGGTQRYLPVPNQRYLVSFFYGQDCGVVPLLLRKIKYYSVQHIIY